MADLIRIDMACNDVDNGRFVGRVCQIALPNGMLELTANAWNITSFYRCPKFRESLGKITLAGKSWPIRRSVDWYGNWCWNAYWLDADVTVRFLVWLHGRELFHCEAGWAALCDLWARPAPLRLTEEWRREMVRETAGRAVQSAALPTDVTNA